MRKGCSIGGGQSCKGQCFRLATGATSQRICTSAAVGAVGEASAEAMRRQRAASTARVRDDVVSLRSTLMPLCRPTTKQVRVVKPIYWWTYGTGRYTVALNRPAAKALIDSLQWMLSVC